MTVCSHKRYSEVEGAVPTAQVGMHPFHQHGLGRGRLRVQRQDESVVPETSGPPTSQVTAVPPSVKGWSASSPSTGPKVSLRVLKPSMSASAGTVTEP